MRFLRGNLSCWALSHQALILFIIAASTLAGIYAFFHVGRAEYPPFAFKQMTIRTDWPGATAREVERLITDPIEKKLEELPYYDFDRSYSRPDQSVIILVLKDYTPPSRVPDLWYQVRKKVGDIRDSLPADIKGPFFNDEFGDVYSFIYAFMGEDFAPAQMKKIVEEVRERILAIPGVEKADLLDIQDQKIYVDLATRQMASYGISGEQLAQAIRFSNTMIPSARVDAGPDRMFLRIDAGFDGAAAIRAIPIEAGGKQITIGDITTVTRSYIDPKVQTMRYRGRDAIGLGIVMAKGANVLTLAKALSSEFEKVKTTLPAGVDVAP